MYKIIPYVRHKVLIVEGDDEFEVYEYVKANVVLPVPEFSTKSAAVAAKKLLEQMYTILARAHNREPLHFLVTPGFEPEMISEPIAA